MVFKEDLEEADGGEEEDNPSIGEWRPPTDNVTALRGRQGSRIPHTTHAEKPHHAVTLLQQQFVGPC